MNKQLVYLILINLFFSFVKPFRKVGSHPSTYEIHPSNQTHRSTNTGDSSSSAMPVIGILDSPLTRFLKNEKYNKKDTMIPSSYVEFIESTGASTLRIPYYASYQMLDYYLQNINGLMLTGGSQLVRNEKTMEISNYGKKVRYLLKKVIELNEKGQIFPVYGICNGFSQIVCSFSSIFNNLSGNKGEHNDKCQVLMYQQHKEEKKKVKFTQPYIEPFLSMKDYLIDVLEEKEQLHFYHSLYLEPEKFKNNTSLSNNFNVSSMCYDDKNQTFISSLHHKQYPIFADVFHPEKSLFEWKGKSIGHRVETMLFGYYTAKYFIDQAKKNDHSADPELIKIFIENLRDSHLVETPNLTYQSIYVFKYDKSLE